MGINVFQGAVWIFDFDFSCLVEFQRCCFFLLKSIFGPNKKFWSPVSSCLISLTPACTKHRLLI